MQNKIMVFQSKNHETNFHLRKYQDNLQKTCKIINILTLVIMIKIQMIVDRCKGRKYFTIKHLIAFK